MQRRGYVSSFLLVILKLCSISLEAYPRADAATVSPSLGNTIPSIAQLGSATQPPAATGNCSYAGVITIDNSTAQYYTCSSTTTDNSTESFSSALSMAKADSPASDNGNDNYYIQWSSGSCNEACTGTELSETNIFKPNTAYWIPGQDNALGADSCGELINYQLDTVAGTSGNNYANYWYDGIINYEDFCLTTSYSVFTYNTLSGDNLNSGTTFQTWYTLNSKGAPATAYVEIQNTQVGEVVYSSALPSQNPNIKINGWQDLVVCNSGCDTDFTQGGGTIGYYQNNIVVKGPTSQFGVAENSNCVYADPTVYTGFADQTFQCP
jgi:hypothetical protein